MFNHISNLLPRLRVYEELFPGHENLVHSISMIYFDVLKFCSDAKDVFRRAKHSILKLVWKPFERQFGSHLDAFRRHQEEMNKDISLSHMIEAADSRALIRSSQRDVVKQRYGMSFHVRHMHWNAISNGYPDVRSRATSYFRIFIIRC